MTRYRDIPRIHFHPKKGTSRRIRRAVKLHMDAINFKYGEKIIEVTAQAAMDQMLYGVSQIKVYWNGDDIELERLEPT